VGRHSRRIAAWVDRSPCHWALLFAGASEEAAFDAQKARCTVDHAHCMARSESSGREDEGGSIGPSRHKSSRRKLKIELRGLGGGTGGEAESIEVKDSNLRRSRPRNAAWMKRRWGMMDQGGRLHLPAVPPMVHPGGQSKSARRLDRYDARTGGRPRFESTTLRGLPVPGVASES
jgi:hypothetical protein